LIIEETNILSKQLINNTNNLTTRTEITLRNKNPLTVVELTKKDAIEQLQLLHKVSTNWMNFISELDNNYEKNDKLLNYHTICKYTTQYVENVCNNPTNQRVFIALSTDSHIHGIAIINIIPKKQSKIELQYLLGNPLLMDDVPSKGAGTALVKKIGMLAQELEKTIILKTTPSAEGFYSNLGFTTKNGSMVLPPNKLETLFKK